MQSIFLLLLRLGVLITSLIILFLVSSSLLGGVTCLFHENDILCNSLSSLISPLSSLLTFIVLSFLLILKEHGLHLHFTPLGFISISFLNCNFPLHKGQSNVINLLVNFLSSSNVIVVGSSSDNSKSSGTGFLLIFFSIAFFLGIYIRF